MPWGSESTARTRRSAAARLAARLMAVVVLPTPPFWLATAMIRPNHPPPKARRIARAPRQPRCFTWNTRARRAPGVSRGTSVERAGSPRATAPPEPGRRGDGADRGSGPGPPGSMSVARSARARVRARTRTVRAGRPGYSSWRPRNTRTSSRPVARVASRRKATRRSRGSTRVTCRSGRRRASTRPGDPLPEPRSRTLPSANQGLEGKDRGHERRHPLLRGPRAREVDPRAPGGQQAQIGDEARLGGLGHAQGPEGRTVGGPRVAGAGGG